MEELERERHAYLVSEKQRYEDEVYALARKLEQLASTIDVVGLCPTIPGKLRQAWLFFGAGHLSSGTCQVEKF